MTRILSAIVLVAVVVATVWFAPDWLFLLVVGLVVAAAVVEYANLVEKTGLVISRPTAVTSAIVTGAAMVMPMFPASLPLAAVLIAVCAIVLGASRPAPHVPALAAALLFPSFYIGLPLGLLAAVRADRGREAVLFVLLIVAVSDTAQYYVGTWLGRHRLAPAVSPKKSVEGAVGGLVASAAVAAFLGHLAFGAANVWWLAVVGLVMAALGVIGDLFESLLKRSAGVKDSSNLIPGHGGVLDRIDALLLAVPGFYLFLHFLI